MKQGKKDRIIIADTIWAMYSGKYDGGFKGAPAVWQRPKPRATGYMGLDDILPGQKPKRQDYAGYPKYRSIDGSGIVGEEENA